MKVFHSKDGVYIQYIFISTVLNIDLNIYKFKGK